MRLYDDGSGTIWLIKNNDEEIRLKDLSPSERQEVLDELVHDAKGDEAAAINNASEQDQLAYLLGNDLPPTQRQQGSAWRGVRTPPAAIVKGAAAHDHQTTPVYGRDLNDTHTLVGESGGLSSIYETTGSNLVLGCVVVATEHGPLYLDPDQQYLVLEA